MTTPPTRAERPVAEIQIYGASDDLIEVAGCEGAGEFNTRLTWHGDLIAPGGEAMRIHVFYDGCWHVAVGQADEGIPLPPWPVSFVQHPDIGYSVLASVSAPDGTRLDNVWPKQDGEADG